MYDIHSHILPGIDDGSRDMEEAISAARLAHEEGITHIVLTPHNHHPLNFEKKDIEKEAERFREVLHKENIPLTLILGAENYISRKKIHHLDNLNLKPMGETKYLLIEFSRYATIREIDEACHELRLKGYLPIIAHVEIYDCFYHHIDELISLRKDGTYFQGNANHLMEKSKKSRALYHYIELGLIDFIATDGHGMHYRPPKIKEAYTIIERKYGKEVAKALFITNSKQMLEGVKLPHAYITPQRKKKKPYRIAAALLITCGLIVSSAFALQDNHPKELAEGDVKETAQIEEETTGVINNKENNRDASQEEAEQGNASVVDEASLNINNQEDKANQDDTIEQVTGNQEVNDQPEESAPVISHEEKLIGAYVAYLESLQDKLLVQIDGYYQQLVTISQLEDETEQERQALNIQDQINALEIEVDNDLNKTLYDMQNDLEQYDYDTAIVQELRDQYFGTKSQVSAEYQAKIQALGNRN